MKKNRPPVPTRAVNKYNNFSVDMTYGMTVSRGDGEGCNRVGTVL